MTKYKCTAVTSIGLLSLLLIIESVHAAAGTSKVAGAGQKAYVANHWPLGVGELLADPTRGDGWNSWFTEWPNDVNHYQFQVTSMQDINRLLKRLAAIRHQDLQLRLSPLAEPSGFGWVSRFPKGNGTAVVFSLGDQQRVNTWYQGLRGSKFGVMDFNEVPVAVPPTLTIYVGHRLVEMESLTIPGNLQIMAGDLPGPFHDWKLKKQTKPAKRQSSPARAEKQLSVKDQQLRENLFEIQNFLATHDKTKEQN